MEAWGADVRCVPKGGLHMYDVLLHALCFVWTDQREDRMLSLLGWYYMGVPGCRVDGATGAQVAPWG